MGADEELMRVMGRTVKEARKKNQNKGDNVSQLEYEKIIGSVMCFMNYT